MSNVFLEMYNNNKLIKMLFKDNTLKDNNLVQEILNTRNNIEDYKRVIDNIEYILSCIEDKQFDVIETRPLSYKLKTINRRSNVYVLPIFSLFIKDLCKVLYNGTCVSFSKYDYLTYRDKTTIDTLLNSKLYTTPIDITIPNICNTVNTSSDIETLIKVIGIEETIRVVKLLLHFGYVELS